MPAHLDVLPEQPYVQSIHFHFTRAVSECFATPLHPSLQTDSSALSQGEAVTNALRGGFLQKAQNHLLQQLHFILQARPREVSVHMLQVGYRDLDQAAQKLSSTEASSWLCRKEAAIGMVLGKSLCPRRRKPDSESVSLHLGTNPSVSLGRLFPDL